MYIIKSGKISNLYFIRIKFFTLLNISHKYFLQLRSLFQKLLCVVVSRIFIAFIIHLQIDPKVAFPRRAHPKVSKYFLITIKHIKYPVVEK